MQQNNFLNNAFLHHLSIQCADPKSLSSFYSETLGMKSKQIHHQEKIKWLCFGNDRRIIFSPGKKKNLDFVNIKSTIKTLLKKTRDKIKLRGSIVNEITTKGNFIAKIRDSLRTNQNNKYRLEVVSLKDSKTAEAIIVELNITKI